MDWIKSKHQTWMAPNRAVELYLLAKSHLEIRLNCPDSIVLFYKSQKGLPFLFKKVFYLSQYTASLCTDTVLLRPLVLFLINDKL